MNKLMNLLVLSCKKATSIMEKREVDSLSIKEKIHLKLHTSVCKACSGYEKQSKTLDNALSKILQNNKQEEQKLSDKTRKKILGEIKKLNHNP